ncbi:hypothetical protein GJAV_G00219160 [Gymnothorax javanicus]|nr:hypothetical protein GJAV_G00219160 [Gymnothorax javanicus]
MDPSSTTEVAEDTKERKKIKFTVPAIISSQLDPRQVEMIRRRRPTPATLFRLADPSSPDDDSSTHPCAAGENGMLKPKHVNQGVYQPPSLKAVQRMAQAHLQKLGAYTTLEDPPEGGEFEEEEEDSQELDSQSEELQKSEVAAWQVPGKKECKEDEEEGAGRERRE